jgi:hypothetical protein
VTTYDILMLGASYGSLLASGGLRGELSEARSHHLGHLPFGRGGRGGGRVFGPGDLRLVLLESEGTKRRFEITDEGEQYLRENQAALNSAMARMEMAARAASGEAPPMELHHAMHILKASLQFHLGGWDDKETDRVRKIIEGAAETIARGGDRE